MYKNWIWFSRGFKSYEIGNSFCPMPMVSFVLDDEGGEGGGVHPFPQVE